MAIDFSKVFNEIFQFATKVNLESKDAWHPENKKSVDVYLYGASKQFVTWMQVDVFAVGKATTKIPTATFVISTNKPYAEMYEGVVDGKRPKEIDVAKVIDMMKDILSER